jgi:hypothetical protein
MMLNLKLPGCQAVAVTVSKSVSLAADRDRDSHGNSGNVTQMLPQNFGPGPGPAASDRTSS